VRSVGSLRRLEVGPIALDARLERLHGLGPRRVEAWSRAGVRTVGELLRWPPRRHVHFAAPTPIDQLIDGAPATIRVEVRRRRASGRRGVARTQLDVRDGSGEVAAILFGPRWLARSFARGEQLLLRGERRTRGAAPEFLVRAWLHGEELPPADAPAWQPHYSLPELIAPRLHRRLLRSLLSRLPPAAGGLRPAWAAAAAEPPPTLAELLRSLHFPRSEEEGAAARRAFALEAAVAVQRRLVALRQAGPRRAPPPDGAVDRWLAEYLHALPFEPTADQLRALQEIASDLRGDRAMARLLSGDVGTGKSAVAFFPLVAAARGGRQGALLAPTEILARQHHATLTELLVPLGLEPPRLVTAEGVRARRGAAREGAIGELLAVGTHRLLSAPVRFRDLAAVVIDEQHKFGVGQRARLFGKGRQPDLLLVSATPIPRTLAHSLFGHLEVSLLAQLPFDRRCVSTELLLGEQRRALGARLRAELAAGGKAFVVCPAVGAAVASTRALPSAERVARWLQGELGGASRVELLHGRLGGGEKLARLGAFTRGEARVLVATVVVEVGIDVPDATLAVVLAAERFGLSQLHQIRGRIGRRGRPARCLVVSADPSQEARSRLEEFARIDDGFALAEVDFRSRGPGELLGLRQHGRLSALYPEALLDPALVTAARELARSRRADRNSAPVSRFRESAVASPGTIW